MSAELRSPGISGLLNDLHGLHEISQRGESIADLDINSQDAVSLLKKAPSDQLMPPRDMSNVNNSADASDIDIPDPPASTPIAQPPASPAPTQQAQKPKPGVFNYPSNYDSNRRTKIRRRSSSMSTKPSFKKQPSKRPLSAKARSKPRIGATVEIRGDNKYTYNYKRPGAVFGGTPRACNQVAFDTSVPPVGLYQPKVIGKRTVGGTFPQSSASE